MKSGFGGTRGVRGSYREGHGVVVEHDGGVASVEQLMDILRGLTSFYENHFVPSIMQDPGDKS